MKIPGSLAAISAFLLISVIPGVSETASPSASPEVERFIKAQGIPLLEPAAGTRFEADVRKEHAAWLKRNIVDPSLERLGKTNPDLGVELEAIGEAVIPVAFDFPSFPFDEVERRISCAKLKPLILGLFERNKELVTDPFLAWVAARMDRGGERNWRYAADLMVKAQQSAPYPDSPPPLRMLIGITWLEARAQGNHWPKQELGDMLKIALECAEDPAVFTPEEGELSARILSRALTDRAGRHFPEISKKIAYGKAVPEWASETLVGVMEKQIAWYHRKGGYQVTREGAKGYREHMAIAEGHLRKAYELNPASPIAAWAMIDVTMSGSNGEGTEKDWFERAVKAQFDYLPAYRQFISAMRPRWGGDHNKMLAYGLSCARTQRYDTLVPNEFFLALNGIITDLGAWEKLYANPLVGPVMLEVSKRYVDAPNFARQRDARESYLVLNAWLAGYRDEAVEAMKAVNRPFDSAMEQTASFHGIDTTDLRGLIAIHAKGLDGEWAALMKDYEAGQLANAREKLDSVSRNFSGSEMPVLLRSMRSALDVEEKLEAGEWAKLEFTPDLAGWKVVSGDWRPGRDATLLNHGHEATGVILHRARVGADFEARGRFSVDAKNTCCRGAGIVIGHNGGIGDDAGFITCAAAQEGQSKLTGRILNGTWNSAHPKKVVGIHDKYDFKILAKDGKLTFSVNGIEVCKDYVPKPGRNQAYHGMSIAKNGLFGFAHPRWCAQNVTKFEKFEVRRLK